MNLSMDPKKLCPKSNGNNTRNVWKQHVINDLAILISFPANLQNIESCLRKDNKLERFILDQEQKVCCCFHDNYG